MIELVKKVTGPGLNCAMSVVRKRTDSQGKGVGKVDNELASEKSRGKFGREEVV